MTLDLLLGDFPEPICKFVGDWRFLSNFYDRPLIFDGIAYRSSEAAYQAQKDPAIAKEFADLSPTDAKALGRWVTPRADWNEARVEVMRRVLRAKFDQNLDLWAKLVATAPRRLIEGNTWGDTFWGRCRGKGENWLGKLLMELRDHYLIPPPIPPPTPPILTIEDLMTDDLKLVTVPSADPEEAPPVPKDDRHPNRKILDDYCDAQGDSEMLTADGFDEAILGIACRACKEPVVAYDRQKCIEILAAQMTPDPDPDGQSAWEMAEEYFEFNVIGGWVGERTPMFLTTITQLEEGFL